MLTLAVETSSELGSVALINNDQLVEQKTWSRQGSHSEFLTASVENLLAEKKLRFSQIERFAVGTGPGSFTGIRVAINFVRAASYALAKPVCCLSSLQLLAHQEGLANHSGPIAVLHFGFRDIFYRSRYQLDQGRCTEILVPTALEAKAIPTRLHTADRVIGSGVAVMQTHFNVEWQPIQHQALAAKTRPEARAFANFFAKTLVGQPSTDWIHVIPLYIRASEAEEKLSSSN